MKKPILITITLLVSCTLAHAQEPPATYHDLVKAADSLLAQNQYLPAAQKYSAAFKSFGWRGYTTHRYDAARSWALAGVADSAFFNLEHITSKANFSDFKTLEREPAFASLHADARWPELVKLAKKNSGIDEATFNRSLFQWIDSLAREDQKWRQLSRELRNSHADSVKQAEALEMMRRTDSLNHLALTDIVERHGFPDYDQLGAEGTHNFWLLMQHQDQHPDFQQRVLKMMETAVGQNKADGKDYAYLLDRVMVNTGEQQVYGTQMSLNAEGTSFEPKSCVDPENLDKRRASVGLGTMASYIEIMNQNYRGSLKSKN